MNFGLHADVSVNQLSAAESKSKSLRRKRKNINDVDNSAANISRVIDEAMEKFNINLQKNVMKM